MNCHKTLLPHYNQILQGEIIPNYIKSKYIFIEYDEKDSTENLWKIHSKINTSRCSIKEEIADLSLFDLKIELARRMHENCTLCHHRCGINRKNETGFCNVAKPRISSMFHHMGEEPMLIPSLTVFFSGCNFNCLFCQNHDISQYPSKGLEFDEATFTTQLNKTIHQSTKNINWVGGDPTPNLYFILNVLKRCNQHIPQIWNSNMYCSIETMRILDGIIDLYLTDFKFGNDTCAKNLSNISEYFETITRNHKIATSQTDVIIRHLMIPGHKICCTKPILSWIKENLKQPLINIMDQYYPCYRAINHKELNKVITMNDYQDVISFSKELGLTLIK